jgi:hypothetical protein
VFQRLDELIENVRPPTKFRVGQNQLNGCNRGDRGAYFVLSKHALGFVQPRHDVIPNYLLNVIWPDSGLVASLTHVRGPLERGTSPKMRISASGGVIKTSALFVL